MMDRDEDRGDAASANDGSIDETRLLDHGGPGSDASDTYVEPHERAGTDPGDRYLIGEALGEGGMAVVHLATDLQLQRPVAIKRLRSEYASQIDIRRRFFAEAEILASLDHPGATSVFEAGLLPDGDCFYAMKKVRGQTLGELMAERIPDHLLDRSVRARFIGIFSRVCETVAAAHDQGIIHRDLKPDNIMVDNHGTVFVMDWGLAKQLVEDDDGSQSDSQRTRLGAVMGTPAYMSPEQASGHAAESDRQTDVFSLGVMLYEILTGANPFRGETAVESMKGVMYHEPEPPTKHNSRIGRTISAITMKALAKDPFKRYRSAEELADDIRRYREFRPVSAIAPTRFEELANWYRRRPRLATSLVTLAAVLLVAVLATAFQASVENARVAQGYGYIDFIEGELADFDAEMSDLIERRDSLEPGPERQVISYQLADLEARHEMAEKDRLAISLAITGFTILSPEQRAREVVRSSILDDIEEHIEVGDYYRARAGIDSALGYAEEGNIFSFSAEDREYLRDQLASVERRIDDSELAAREPAERGE